MFKNSGKKLMGLAKLNFWLLTIAGCYAAIGFFDATQGISLLLIPAAVFLGWLTSILLYAFGELCSNVYNISKNDFTTNSDINEQISSADKVENYNGAPPVVTKDTGSWKCKKCGTTNAKVQSFCSECGKLRM
ncbi:MAG: zinc ribbon domain-containing protein [Ruminococcus sp.]|nr:zinc ribbon domain-containing protein [Ruminococcus sp.]